MTIASALLVGAALSACFPAHRSFARHSRAEPESGSPELAEPPYCDLRTFTRTTAEQHDGDGLRRTYVFKLGKVTLVGLAVGGSDPDHIKRLAERYSSPAPQPSDKFCTWYVNKGKKEQERLFNWQYVESAKRTSPAEAAAHYAGTLHDIFDENATSFLSCAEDHGYIALGCNGMKHRGPSVMGMLLAYTGCTPQHALEIVNNFWGGNGVDDDTRTAIIREGYDLGRAHPEASARLRALLTDTPP